MSIGGRGFQADAERAPVAYADRSCMGAWETTLHLLAKEVVTKARKILRPDIIVRRNGRELGLEFAVTRFCDGAKRAKG